MQLNMAKLAIETGFIKDGVLPGTLYLYVFNYAPVQRILSEFHSVRTTRSRRSNILLSQSLREAR